VDDAEEPTGRSPGEEPSLEPTGGMAEVPEDALGGPDAPAVEDLEEDVPSTDPSAASYESWIRSALAYVPSVARRYLGCGLPFEELLAAGNLGLVEAALRFDPGRGVKFVTYADWWIRKAILMAVEEQAGPVRLPRYRLEQLRAIHDARASLRHKTGREPDAEAIARVTGFGVEDVVRLLSISRQSVSLEQPATPGGERPLREVLAQDLAKGPQSVLLREDSALRLRRHVAAMGMRERVVLTLRYGLGGSRPLTLRQVGDALQISRERVRQIEHRALRDLKRLLEHEGG